MQRDMSVCIVVFLVATEPRKRYRDRTTMSSKASIFLLVLAVTALSLEVHGFSLTMSSYLDQIASGHSAGLTSFAPSAGNSYGASATPSYSYGSSPAPASYTTPAAQSSYSYGASPTPAPPAYVNGFAHIAPNKDLNYIATLGGGSAKKWGRDYSGVSSTFRPTYSVGNASYLDQLKGKVFALSAPPQPASSSSSQSSYSYNPAAWTGHTTPAPSSNSYSYGSPAPAPASYSYGGSAAAPANPSYSYGGSAAAPANPSYSYGSSAAAPTNPSYSYGGSAAAPANPSYSYGGSAAVPANPSYSYGGSAAAPANPSYSYGASSPASYSAPDLAPKSTSSYLASL
jgi:hypothetical protein